MSARRDFPMPTEHNEVPSGSEEPLRTMYRPKSANPDCYEHESDDDGPFNLDLKQAMIIERSPQGMSLVRSGDNHALHADSVDRHSPAPVGNWLSATIQAIKASYISGRKSLRAGDTMPDCEQRLWFPASVSRR